MTNARLPERASGSERDEADAHGALSTGFLASVWRRAGGRLWLWALPVLAATDVLGRVGRAGLGQRWTLPRDHAKAVVLTEIVMFSAVLFAVLIADEAVARGARRWTTFLGAVLAACAVGSYVQYLTLVRLDWDTEWIRDPDPWVRLNQPLGTFFTAWLYGSLACIVYVKLGTARAAADRMRAAELARVSSRRRTLESQLQAMQARVEPEFLFNTLVHVRSLFESDVAMAGRMLEDLIAYLRAALPHLRESGSTLGQEIALARAYLEIMRVRLGDGLMFEIDLPEAAASARIPPMMLLPLVDHALASGRDSDDGRVALHIGAATYEGRIVLTISAGGDAFVPDARTPGIDNISRRLHALYGTNARLDLDRRIGFGTRATLEICRDATDGSDR